MSTPFTPFKWHARIRMHVHVCANDYKNKITLRDEQKSSSYFLPVNTSSTITEVFAEPCLPGALLLISTTLHTLWLRAKR